MVVSQLFSQASARVVRAGVIFATVLLYALFGAAAAAAGGSSEAEGEAGADGDSQSTDELIIYTYDAFPEGLEELIVSHFQQEYAVSATIERFQDTGGLFNEVMLTRGEGAADLVIGLDNTYIGRALEEDLFQPTEPAEIGAVREDLILDESNRLVPFDYGNIVLNYDSEALPDPPTTWEELLDPSLRESIVLLNPATSSPGRNFLLLTIDQFGEDGYLDFWRELEPNILTITSGWSDGYGLYTQGEAPIVLSYETSPAYHIAFEDTDRYKNLILNGVGYAQIEVMGVLQDAPNAENAHRAVDFILSPEFQREIALNQFMYPVREDVELPDSFQQLDRPEETAFIDVNTVDERYDAWLDEWEAVMR
ncbi:MAG: thiamine ABC transporter substrate-binding protein [Alkalispirochaeta sp.]